MGDGSGALVGRSRARLASTDATSTWGATIHILVQNASDVGSAIDPVKDDAVGEANPVSP
jgi:hypothetical protein